MVFVPFKHMAGAKQVSLCPIKVVGQAFTLSAMIAHAMRFYVGFVNNIETIFVSQIIEKGGLRIVAQADGIYIKLLHPFHIEHHILLIDYLTVYLVKFVKVYSFQQHRLTIDQVLSVFYLACPETNFY